MRIAGVHAIESLVVVGAGPKALAVAAKAAVMAELGAETPRVTVVEAISVGANWLPVGGWTDGKQRLGTNPEKDLGFPYRSTVLPGHNNAVDRGMARLGWTAFLIDQGSYAEWVDRGRPNPHHHQWAKYLQWVAGAIDLDLVLGTVTLVAYDHTGWRLDVCTTSGDRRDIVADAVMFTGPGPSDVTLLNHPRMLSPARFWDLAGRRQLPACTRAAVIGGGETAGSALDELTRHDALTITAVSPAATLYSRGESYFENALFSNPSTWGTLSQPERRDVIRRTDRGVFSLRVQEALLADNRVHHMQGRIVGVRGRAELIELTLRNDGRADRTDTFDLVVDATGGRPLWFLDLFDPVAADMLEIAVGSPLTREKLESAIRYDLSVAGLSPRLFLPNLAGLAQGPGFPNLSCLGVLSNRVLGVGSRHPVPYVTLSHPRP